MEAKVLRLLRHDARMWWWFKTLRSRGQIAEATRLERESIRNDVKFIRENIARPMTTYRTSVIEFLDRPRARPFDLSIERPWGGNSYTAMVSGCHVGSFAAWVYCYAHRIGLKLTAKATDLV